MPRVKLSNVPINALQAEIQRRFAKLANMIAQRDELNRQIAALEQVQGVASSAVTKTAAAQPVRRGRGARTRRAGGKPLGQYVIQVLTAAPSGLSVKDIERAVLAAGYPTSAKTIYNPIMKVLPKVSARKIGRGVYSLKAGAAKMAAKVAKPKAVVKVKPKAAKRKTYSQTAEQLILSLVGSTGATTSQINKAWKAQRPGAADTTILKLVQAGKLKRTKLKDAKGSTYTVA